MNNFDCGIFLSDILFLQYKIKYNSLVVGKGEKLTERNVALVTDTGSSRKVALGPSG